MISPEESGRVGVLMFSKTDTRLGRELGLTGGYAELPAFQIVNDAHDVVAALTSRMVGLEYGSARDRATRASVWPTIAKVHGEFIRRVANLDGDAVKAAGLCDEIEAFQKQTLDPFVAEIEERD